MSSRFLVSASIHVCSLCMCSIHCCVSRSSTGFSNFRPSVSVYYMFVCWFPFVGLSMLMHPSSLCLLSCVLQQLYVVVWLSAFVYLLTSLYLMSNPCSIPSLVLFIWSASFYLSVRVPICRSMSVCQDIPICFYLYLFYLDSPNFCLGRCFVPACLFACLCIVCLLYFVGDLSLSHVCLLMLLSVCLCIVSPTLSSHSPGLPVSAGLSVASLFVSMFFFLCWSFCFSL